MTWLLKSIGVSDEFVTHIDEVKPAFHWELALWVGLALLIPAAYFIYRRQQLNLRTVPFLPRLLLTATRVLILAILVIVLAGPYLKLEQEREKKPIVALLFDHSASMELDAGPFEPEGSLIQMARAAGYRASDDQLDPETRKAINKLSRAKLIQLVVQTQAKKLLEPLASKFEVQLYSVAQDILPLNLPSSQKGQPRSGDFKLPEPPGPRSTWGAKTQMGDAIGHVLNEAAGRQISGILVFTDGQNTGGRSFPEVAREAAGAGTPIFAIPAGTSRRLKDVAIVDVFTTSLVSVGDTVHVAVTVESSGFDGLQQPVKVQLLEDKKVLDSKDLKLRSSEQQVVVLTYQAQKPGSHFLTVQIPPQPDEPKQLHANNTDTAFVRVSEDKLRVLYLEGLPRWDYRFLKNAMRRDHGLGGRKPKSTQPDIVLEAEWRRQIPARQAEALPGTLEALAQYHTIVLGDVSPDMLTPAFLDLLVKAVREKGVGLVIEAGPLHMPHAFDKRLLELLPVRLLRKDGLTVPGLASPDYKPFQLELSPEGSIHESMRFYDDPGRNQNAWRFMPPYYWCAAATRPSPAATVLAWNPNVQRSYGKLPLIAHHFAGKGRVMFVGTDSTWLWRQNVGDRYFYKFWGQALRFVARRDQEGVTKSWMDVRPLRAQPGEKATIELMAYNAKGDPRTDRTLTAHVYDGKTTTILNLVADPAVKGRYTGNFPLEREGAYQVTYHPGSGASPIQSEVRVLTAVEELRHPNVDRVGLQRLGDISGGQLVELTDIATIPEIKGPDGKALLKGQTSISAPVKHEKDIWDNWLVLSVLVLLYCLDVGFRRLAGLS
jgi:hypothetical protein